MPLCTFRVSSYRWQRPTTGRVESPRISGTLSTYIRTQELDSEELLLNRARTQITRPPSTRKNPLVPLTTEPASEHNSF